MRRLPRALIDSFEARVAELLHRWNPARCPRPASGAAAGQFKGIAVVAG